MIDNKTFKAIANEYGTPSFVFDLDEIVRRANNIKSIINPTNNEKLINLCYSIKANPFLMPALKDNVSYFEVCSPGELKICKHYNIPGHKIIYSGVNKGLLDITEAIEYGAGTLTAESIRHYDLICEASKKLNKKVEVILRLTAKSQFGMHLSDIEEILERNINNDMVTISGIHYFAGTGRAKLKHQKNELQMLRETITNLRSKFNIDLPKLEYGPGLNFPYFEGDDFSDTLAPLKELFPDLSEASEWCELTIEMGRFLASSCGYYLTRVADVKSSPEHNWCILDGGINNVNYLGQIMGLKAPIIKLLDQGEDITETKSYALCGSLCTTNDVLVRSYEISDPKIDDLFVFCNIGAYSVTEGINLFLSRNMPRIILYKDNNYTMVRDVISTWELNS